MKPVWSTGMIGQSSGRGAWGVGETEDDVRRSAAVLAARVRDAHAAQVWLPLGYGLFQRALTDVSARRGDVAEPDSPPTPHAYHSVLQAL